METALNNSKMNHGVPTWNQWSASSSELNSSAESAMVENVQEGQRQGGPWEEETTPHKALLAYENDEIFSWIDNYIEDVSFQPDLYGYQTYNPQSCTSSGVPPLVSQPTTTMIGLDVGPCNTGGFSAEPPPSSLTSIIATNKSASEDDKRKATELLDDYEKETQTEEENNPSTKRQRCSATHNLSERRRRDRINEHMRDLQEIIPISSKLDKASVLQGTCEYVKSLTIQLKMFSLICDIHQTMRICFPGNFHMAGHYNVCPSNPSNMPGMLDYANLHSQAHRTALARLCKQYLSVYEREFLGESKPKMLSFANPRYQAQLAGLAQLCQEYISFRELESKQAQDQAFAPIIHNKVTRGF